MTLLELDADGVAAVPTVEELGRRGLARALPSGKWTVLPAGETLLREAMANNARVFAANPELRRRREAAGFMRRPGL